MAALLSYKHAINVIKLLYTRSGFDIIDHTPGEKIAHEFSADISKARHEALFAFVDEYIFIFKYMSHYFMTCAIAKEPTAITYRRLCDAALSSVTAIRMLSSVGLDASARVQLRYLYELSLLWSRAAIDPGLVSDLNNCNSFEDSNAFWHKYLARKRTESYMKRRISEDGIQWFGYYDDGKYLEAIYHKLGLSAHPSFWGMYFNTIAEFSDATDNMAVRSAAQSTFFTLDSTIFLAAAPFSFIPLRMYQFECVDLFEPKKIYPPHRKRASTPTFREAHARLA